MHAPFQVHIERPFLWMVVDLILSRVVTWSVSSLFVFLSLSLCVCLGGMHDWGSTVYEPMKENFK